MKAWIIKWLKRAGYAFAALIILGLVANHFSYDSQLERRKQALRDNPPTPIPQPTITPEPDPSATPKPTATPLSPEAQREKAIKRQFSAWNGAHRLLVRTVKERMHDPKSFDHVNTMYKDNGDSLHIIMQFRGKNKFGAIVLNTVEATADLDGNLTNIKSVD